MKHLTPALAALILAVAGCNIVGPAFVLVHGPEKIPAVYTLDPERPTVILVDDRSNRVPRRSLRLTLAQEAEKSLLKEKALKDMIGAQAALTAAGADKDGRPLSIAEIGRAVGAQVVIYATVDQFTLSPDGNSFLPTAQLRVKIIDAVNDKRIWPDDRGGYICTARLPIKGDTAPTTLNEQAKAEDELAQETGLALARLFFKHERPRGAATAE
jgi:hypothetical protein